MQATLNQPVDLISKLSLYPKLMADSVKPWLASANKESYIRFLDMMYHYTFDSGKRLAQAAETASMPEIKNLLQELAVEEANHFRLAEFDLSKFQCKPTLQTPAEVIKFQKFWDSIKTQNQNAYLGALYALENVGQFLHNETLTTMQRLNIQREQARFIMVHLEADLEHGERLRHLCQKYGEDDTNNLLIGAEQGSTFWIALHEKALLGDKAEQGRNC